MYYALFNLEDWENIIHFGNLFASIGKKTYFLALGTIPVTGVSSIARKITGHSSYTSCYIIFDTVMMSGLRPGYVTDYTTNVCKTCETSHLVCKKMYAYTVAESA